MKLSKKYLALRIVMIIGMLLSLYLIYEHFSLSGSKFCNTGEGFDCGTVNKSPYANLDGISYMLTLDFGLNLPVIQISEIHWTLDLLTSNAFLGFMTLAFMFTLTLFYEKKKDFWFIKKGNIHKWLRELAVFCFFYSGYLFLVQKILLKTYCILCLSLDAVLIAQLILVWRMKK